MPAPTQVSALGSCAAWPLLLDGATLRCADVVRIARDGEDELDAGDTGTGRRAHELAIEISATRTVYGRTTGVGANRHVVIDPTTVDEHGLGCCAAIPAGSGAYDCNASGSRGIAGGVEGAIKLGFYSSVMMDGSLREDGKTVADYDYNWQVTKKVVEMAQARVSVKGELVAWVRSKRCAVIKKTGTRRDHDDEGDAVDRSRSGC